MRKASASVK
jgi:hypothetical protein